MTDYRIRDRLALVRAGLWGMVLGILVLIVAGTLSGCDRRGRKADHNPFGPEDVDGLYVAHLDYHFESTGNEPYDQVDPEWLFNVRQNELLPEAVAVAGPQGAMREPYLALVQDGYDIPFFDVPPWALWFRVRVTGTVDFYAGIGELRLEAWEYQTDEGQETSRLIEHSVATYTLTEIRRRTPPEVKP